MSHWINLQPYESPIYIVCLIVALIPLMIGLYMGKRFHWYETLVSFIFILFIFDGDKVTQGISLIGYMIVEMIIVLTYAHYRMKPNSPNKTWVFVLTVFLSIVQLAIVKLTPLFTSGKNSILGFLGISYLTFRVVGTIMEIRDGSINAKNFDPRKFFHFVLFMPTISEGPIDRYRRWVKDYDQVPDREKYLKMLGKATHYIMLGLFYNFILGYLFGKLMLPNVEHLAMLSRHNFLGISWGLVGVMYVYSMYLFFNFAGYSLFAVAISYMMGIETPMNFNKPFMSYNIKDFWNRWHMTLSFWFRDYIYMRLVFFLMKHKWIKSRVTIANLGYLTLFMIMAVWHGETWYYMLYGLYQACAMIINDAWIRWKRKHKDLLPSNKFTKAMSTFFTFNVVCLSFLIFSGFLNTLWFK